MPRIPIYQQQVEPVTARIDQPEIRPAPRAAFGEDVARAGGEFASDVIDPIAKLFAERAEEARKEDEAAFKSQLFTAFDNEHQDRLYSKDIEVQTVNGQKVEKSQGLLNRTLNNARDSVFEYDNWYRDRKNHYLNLIRDPETRRSMATLLDTEYRNKREALFRHEVGQIQSYREESIASQKEKEKQNFATIQSGDVLKDKIDSLTNTIDTLHSMQGLHPDTSDIQKQEDVVEAIQNTLTSSLLEDNTGRTARELLEKAPEDVLSKNSRNTLNKFIDNEIKGMADERLDILQTKFNNNQLTLEEVLLANKPKTQGGVGGSNARKLAKALNEEQKGIITDLSENDVLASQYIELIDSLIDNNIDRSNFNNLIIDFYANDGVLDPDEKQLISEIKDKLQDVQYNRASGLFTDSWKRIKSWFNRNRQNLDDADLIESARQLMTASRAMNLGEEEFLRLTDSIIRGQQEKINPNAGRYNVGEIIMFEDRAFQVVGFDDDGEPIVKVSQ